MAQGVPSAIAVCSVEAPRIAAALAQAGTKVGRATDRPRNPSNAAIGWQAEALTELRASGKPLQGASIARMLPDGRVGYAEPLVIQELCLACHGTAITPDVQVALAEKYPTDKATGYAVGDLRGVAWVELTTAR